MRKGTTWDKISFSKNGYKVEKSIFFNFLLLGLSETLDFWLYIDIILCLQSCVTKNVVMDIISCSDMHNLIQKITINAYFQKSTF